jgi:hypothetical protein
MFDFQSLSLIRFVTVVRSAKREDEIHSLWFSPRRVKAQDALLFGLRRLRDIWKEDCWGLAGRDITCMVMVSMFRLHCLLETGSRNGDISGWLNSDSWSS